MAELIAQVADRIDRAVQRMPSDVNLQYLRAEAAALLGIELEQKTSDAPGLPKN